MSREKVMSEEQFSEIVSELESKINNLLIELENCQEQNYELRAHISNLEWRIDTLEK